MTGNCTARGEFTTGMVGKNAHHRDTEITEKYEIAISK
jgi:hypothetical protein